MVYFRGRQNCSVNRAHHILLYSKITPVVVTGAGVGAVVAGPTQPALVDEKLCGIDRHTGDPGLLLEVTDHPLAS